MFSSFMELIVLFFLGVLILTPTYIRLTKNSLYNEWKEIWEKEIEAEKKKLAMQGLDTKQQRVIRKQQ